MVEGEAEGQTFSFILPEFLLFHIQVNDVSVCVVPVVRTWGGWELFSGKWKKKGHVSRA